MSFIKDLIKNNTGVSVKSFLMFSTIIMGSFLLLVVGFVLVVEVLKNGTIKTDLLGLSAFVGSITTLLGIAVTSKHLGEKNENKINRKENVEHYTAGK